MTPDDLASDCSDVLLPHDSLSYELTHFTTEEITQLWDRVTQFELESAASEGYTDSVLQSSECTSAQFQTSTACPSAVHAPSKLALVTAHKPSTTHESLASGRFSAVHVPPLPVVGRTTSQALDASFQARSTSPRQHFSVAPARSSSAVMSINVPSQGHTPSHTSPITIATACRPSVRANVLSQGSTSIHNINVLPPSTPSSVVSRQIAALLPGPSQSPAVHALNPCASVFQPRAPLIVANVSPLIPIQSSNSSGPTSDSEGNCTERPSCASLRVSSCAIRVRVGTRTGPSGHQLHRSVRYITVITRGT